MHLFKYQDLYRIVKVVSPVRPSEIPAIMGTILQAEFDMLTGLKKLGGQIIPDIEMMELLAKTLNFLFDLARATNLLPVLIRWMIDLLPKAPPPPPPPPPPAPLPPPEAPMPEDPQYRMEGN